MTTDSSFSAGSESTGSDNPPTYDGFEPAAARRERPPTLPLKKTEPDDVFSDQWKVPFEGLLFLGALQVTKRVFGHEFILRTLHVEDYLRVGQLVSEYKDTLSEQRAYATAIVALSLETVDGEVLPHPFSDTDSDFVNANRKFQYVSRNWYSPLVDLLYNEYVVLERTVREVLVKMGEA